MQGDAWRDAVALIETYDDPLDGGRTTEQAVADRVAILQDCQPREVALALTDLAAAALRHLRRQGVDIGQFLAAVRAAAEDGLGGL